MKSPLYRLRESFAKRLAFFREIREKVFVNEYVDIKIFVLFKNDLLPKILFKAVYPNRLIPFAKEVIEQLVIFALASNYHRRVLFQSQVVVCHAKDVFIRLFSKQAPNDTKYRLAHLFRGKFLYPAPANEAGRPSPAGEKHPEVIIDFGNRCDGGARIISAGFLVNGNCGRETDNFINVRFLHLSQELARVGGKRFHVAPLPLGEDRIKRKRRFSRAGEARKNNELVARQLDRDIFQVVCSSSFYDDFLAVTHVWVAWSP